MLAEYFLVFFWGFFILFAWVGYGRLLNVLLLPKKKLGWGLWVCSGLALSAVVGGFFNLTKTVSPLSVKIFVVLGFLIFLFFTFRKTSPVENNAVGFVARCKEDKLWAVLAFSVVAILLFRYATSVSFYGFHGDDDYHAYLVFPEKMIQTGSLGDEPFSERRIYSSFGGQYFLDTLVLSMAPDKYLHLVDNGLGFIILVILIAGLLSKGQWPSKTGLFLLLAVSIIPSPSDNLTSVFSAAAIFLAVLRFCFVDKWRALSPLRNAVFAALLFAALFSLKLNLIPAVVVVYLAYYFVLFKTAPNDWRVILKELFFSALFILLFLFPWMAALYQSSGTFLYPILGRGFHGSVYDPSINYFLRFDLYSLLRIISEFIVGLPLFVPLLILAVFGFFITRPEERRIFMVITLSVCFGLLSLIFLSGGISLYYYSLPFVLPAVVLFVVLAIQGVDWREGPGTGKSLGLLIIALIFGSYLQKDVFLMNSLKNEINIDGDKIKIGLLNSELVPPAEQKNYRALQLALPPDVGVLSRLDRDFLWDFKRNPVYVIDIPGGASLPPGMPVGKGGEKLADYLLARDIRYVAYSYGNEAGFTEEIFGSMLRPHVNPLARTQVQHTFDFQKDLSEIGKTKKIIYDDGKNFVADLLNVK